MIDTETIEIVNRYYHVSSPKGPKRYRLFGRNFYADISYLPSAYDPRRLLYEVKLIKLDRNKKIINGFDQNFERPSSFVTAAQKNGIDSNNITDSFIDSKRSDDDDDGEFSDVGMKSKSNDERNVIDFEKEFFWIQNVSTFVVLSNFEVIVFFHDEFCFINYFTSKVRRSWRRKKILFDHFRSVRLGLKVFYSIQTLFLLLIFEIDRFDFFRIYILHLFLFLSVHVGPQKNCSVAIIWMKR